MEKTIQTVKRKPYQSDLADAQWDLLAPLIVLPEGGRPKTTDLQAGRWFSMFNKNTVGSLKV